jgi:hypothetical protein
VKVADFACYPELMWLHKHELVPPAVLALLSVLIAGWSGLVVGFFWSTVLVYHATFCINSLAHVRGRRRYVTGDDSRNNWLLALFTMGEGWHNNHHAYQSSVRQGFRWWEIDATFYLLKALSWTGLVWDLKTPPAAVRLNEYRLGSRVIERAAAQLAGSFDTELIVRAIAWPCGFPPLDKLAQAQNRAPSAFGRPTQFPQLTGMNASAPGHVARPRRWSINLRPSRHSRHICARLGDDAGKLSALPAPDDPAAEGVFRRKARGDIERKWVRSRNAKACGTITEKTNSRLRLHECATRQTRSRKCDNMQPRPKPGITRQQCGRRAVIDQMLTLTTKRPASQRVRVVGSTEPVGWLGWGPRCLSTIFVSKLCGWGCARVRGRRRLADDVSRGRCADGCRNRPPLEHASWSSIARSYQPER